jgi:carbon monoxide dehydrogenase subunit G
MWFMRPVTVTIDVAGEREDVYDYLDELANHEQFTDQMMRNWRMDGPERGVGAKATVDAVIGGRSEEIEIEVIEAEAPSRNVERNIGAGGRRVATGTYRLDPLPGARTRVTFEYAWQSVPLGERLAGPLVRAVMRRSLNQAMSRLGERLATEG